jgi:hypothetical protein
MNKKYPMNVNYFTAIGSSGLNIFLSDLLKGPNSILALPANNHYSEKVEPYGEIYTSLNTHMTKKFLKKDLK